MDWTKHEMRVYLSIKNNGTMECDVFPNQGTIVQGEKQYSEPVGSVYGMMESRIQPGASIQGVVTFDTTKKKDFRYSSHGYTGMLNMQEYTFDVHVE